MPLIRTPDERFQDLPGFPFQPHYLEVNGARVHYLDEGEGEVILCLHGEPTWSYLYRKMVPPLAEHYRVLAPDFIGFGRSDKYTERDAYSFDMHVATLTNFIGQLKLEHITLVVQDWGGLIGLRTVAEYPERFARLVIMNTGLPTGDVPLGKGFLRWREFAEQVDDLPVGRVIRLGMAHPRQLSPEVLAAYEAPFPDPSYKAGAAVWPLLVPLNEDDPGAVEMRRTRNFLRRWNKPALVLFSDKDPITRGGARFFRALIPSAKQQPEITIHDAGHFLQEEKGEEIAQHILAFIQRTPHPHSVEKEEGGKMKEE